jgi:SAM-dependent methyltransferase
VDDRRPDQRAERLPAGRDLQLIEAGLSFGVAAAEYDRGRPEWPATLVDEVPVPSTATVLDLGAGTGKLTRLLAERFRRVLAIEPDPAMRARLDAGELLAGSAEAIPLADASVDAVFAAEAFHWFDGPSAVSEIARVLAPGGVLALLWNRWEQEDAVLGDDVIPPSTSPKPATFVSGEWRRAFEGAPFEPFCEVSVVQERNVGREELLDYFASISPITSLPDLERTAALARVATALDRHVYRRRWTACLFWTRRS